MQCLFKVRNQIKQSNTNTTLQQWGGKYLQLKKKWAHWMTRQWSKLSWKMQKLVFAMMMLSSMLYSFYLIHKGLSGSIVETMPSTDRIENSIVPATAPRETVKEELREE